jgi:hypothetical protein
MTIARQLAVLKSVHRLVDSPATWTQGGCARDLQGRIVDPLEPEAICFCVFGATIVAEKAHPPTDREVSSGAFSRIEKAASQLYGFHQIISINDGRRRVPDEPRTAVLNCVNRAIATAEAEIAAIAASASH